MLTSLLLSTGLPILLDLIKSAAPAVTRKFIGVSVDDQIKLDQAAIERTKALAELDNPYGTPSQWVVDLRGAFRYVTAIILIAGGLALAAYGAIENDSEALVAGLDLAASPFGFIFGEKLVLSYKGSPR